MFFDLSLIGTNKFMEIIISPLKYKGKTRLSGFSQKEALDMQFCKASNMKVLSLHNLSNSGFIFE